MKTPMNAALPEPDAAALAHSEKVTAYLRTLLVANGGWLSLHDYVQAALYAPGLGYYMAGTPKFGSGGDFITAPELTPLYAQTWAAPLDAAMRCSAPSMLELGGGSGIFAAQLLRRWQEMGGLPERYALLEPSPALRERQRQTLQAEVPDLLSRLVWLDRLPETFHGVVFMNEVLDAIPGHVIERVDGAWCEQGVVFEGGHFAVSRRPLTEPALRALAEARFPPQGDYVAELNVEGESLLETLGRSLTPGSTLFVSDYGFERHGPLPGQYAGGTLRAYYRHRLLDDPLRWPGLLDITAHVDFVAMAEAARRGGLTLNRFQTQGEFLQQHGLLEHLAQHGTPNAANYLSVAQAVRTLLDPEAMGEIFKVVEFRR